MVQFVRRLSFAIASLVFALSFGGIAVAQSFAVSHAKVSIVSETDSFQPGQNSWVGVLFDLEKGWHIYWVNPGDSGEPPKIQWQLPMGFQVKAIRWPTPVRLGTGTVIDYGYEGRVLLPVQMQAPGDYKAGKLVALSADIRYLICREVCIPAKAQASLTVPSGNAANAGAGRQLFQTTFANSPKPLPAGSKATASFAGGFFLLSVETGTSESKATFFPLEEDQVDNAAPQAITATARGVQIKLKISDQLVSGGIPILRGIVVFGPERAFEVSAPVMAKK